MGLTRIITCGLAALGIAAALLLDGRAAPPPKPAPAPASTAPAPQPIPLPPLGRLVRLPDGRHINLRCAGAGSPTVLFEGGFAADSGAWYKVQPQVARTTRACSYDRAGSGRSDPGPLPRDGAAIARDLARTLYAAKIDGPFVLVGHSAGGLYMRVFSDRRPRDVVAMVLVDSSVEHQDARFAAMFGPNAGSTAPIRARAQRCLTAIEANKPAGDPALAGCRERRTGVLRTQISELDNLWTSTSRQLDTGRRSYGAMPLIMLTSARTFPEPAARFWSDLHREVAARSTRGSERMIDSGHMMMIEKPDAVISAIEEVIAMTRESAKRARR